MKKDLNQLINNKTKFGRLFIIKQMPSKNGYRRVLCQCDCGNETEINLFALFGSMPTKSCGCLSTEVKKSKTKANNPRWTGYESISGHFFGSIRSGARKRKLVFDITAKDIFNLFIKQDRKCALTGLDLCFRSCYGKWDGNASLDRIDSSKGYVIGNVQWVHKDVNKMKMDFKQDDFIRLCQLVAKQKVETVPQAH